MKKIMFRISVAVLVTILVLVSFYMLYVHVPYYNYHHNLNEIRNEICETNHYEYMDYFYEYRGKETYYIIKVKINDVLSYVAYDQEKTLVNTFQGQVADEDAVKKAILNKYKINVEELDVGYENNKFVYYAKVQDEESLTYLFYDLGTGEFVKAYKL